MKKFITWFIVFLLITTLIPIFTQIVTASSNTWYVSPTGSDRNDGLAPDDAHAFKTIQKGLNGADTAGDTIYVRSGTYSITSGLICPYDGRAGNYITLARYPSDAPSEVIIDAGGKSITMFSFGSKSNADDCGKNYIRLQNLTFQNSGYRGLVARGYSGESRGHYIVENCTFRYIYYYPALFGNFGTDAIDNVTFRFNTIYDCNCTGYETEVVTFCKCTNFACYNNTMSNGRGIFIGVYGDAKNGAVYNNNIRMDMKSGTKGARGIYLDTGVVDGTQKNISVNNNLIWATSDRFQLTAIGISHEHAPGGLFEDIYIYNNILNITSSASINGIWLDYDDGTPSGVMCDNINIYSNTIYIHGTSSSYWAGIYCTWTNDMCNDINVNNNIIVTTLYGYAMQFTGIQASGENVDPTYNLMYRTDGTASWYFDDDVKPSITGTITSNPEFVDIDSDFHLKSTSPACDTGFPAVSPSFDFDYISRPQKGGYDIGAYEYATATQLVITNVRITPETQQIAAYLNISCNVIENGGAVDDAGVRITYPDHTIKTFKMNSHFYLNQTYSQVGTYHFFIWAFDSNGNSGNSEEYTFQIIPIFKNTVLIGMIIDNSEVNNSLISIKTNSLLCLEFDPFEFNILASKEQIFVSKDYIGYIGTKFIIGMFKVALL